MAQSFGLLGCQSLGVQFSTMPARKSYTVPFEGTDKPLLSTLYQWFLTFVTRMLLNCNSQKPQSGQLVVKASESCSPKLLSNPRLRTSALEQGFMY